MEGESSPVKSFKTEIRLPGGLLILLLMAALIDPGVTSHNPHQPAKITWKLMSYSMRLQESTLQTPGGQIYILI